METTENQNKNKRNYTGLIGIGVGFIVIVAIYVLTFEFMYNGLYIEDPELAAQFGDMFGSVNSLFSALAFLVISISLYLQNRELKLQRLQLELQREDAVTTRESQLGAQEAQRKEMELTRQLHAKSNFESKFIFLLKNFERQISLTSGNFIVTLSSGKKGTITGYKYFTLLYAELSTIHKFSSLDYKVENQDYYDQLLSYYGLLNNNDYQAKRSAENPEDFSKITIRTVENKRIGEYFNSWLTFGVVVRMLQEEYLNWNKNAFGTQEEIDRNFVTYAELVKSTAPLTVRVIYLYINLIDRKYLYNDFIHKKLYDDIRASAFFHPKHKELLFEKN